MNVEFYDEYFDDEIDVEAVEEALDDWGNCNCSNGCFDCLDVSIRDFM